MAEQNPLKKAVDLASQKLMQLHQEYQKFFLGAEKKPPLAMRRDLDLAMSKIKAETAKSSSIASKFAANGLVNKYQLHCSQWDKTMREIENGTHKRPPSIK